MWLISQNHIENVNFYFQRDFILDLIAFMVLLLNLNLERSLLLFILNVKFYQLEQIFIRMCKRYLNDTRKFYFAKFTFLIFKMSLILHELAGFIYYLEMEGGL